MSFLGFETPEENYARAKARYYAKHGRPKNPRPVKYYRDGFYDPNIKYSAVKTLAPRREQKKGKSR